MGGLSTSFNGAPGAAGVPGMVECGTCGCAVPACNWVYRDCECDTVLDSCDGSSDDGSESDASYDDNLNRCWLIRPKARASKISFEFTRFDTEATTHEARVTSDVPSPSAKAATYGVEWQLNDDLALFRARMARSSHGEAGASQTVRELMQTALSAPVAKKSPS